MAEFKFSTEKKQDCEAINKLHAHLFGPARFTKAAHLIREHGHTDLNLSFTIYEEDKLIGSLRITPIKLGRTKALLLGPLAINNAYQSRGLGSKLMHIAINKIKEIEVEAALILLIGDLAYYSKFGFSKLDSNRLTMPAPVDPARILGLELKLGSSNALSGIVLPDI